MSHTISKFFIVVTLTMSAISARAGFTEELTSPWTQEKARTILIVGGLTTAGLLIFKHEIVDPFQEETVEDKPLGRLSVVGDYAGQMIPNAIYAAAMYTDYWISKDVDSLRRAKLMIKASLYAGGVTTVLKEVVREPRPNSPTSRVSFPSGHSTTAFAFSSVVLAEHGAYWGSGALLLSTLTAYSRINDNKHYLHDVVAGATIGAAYGFGLASLSQKEKAKSGEVAYALFPYYSHDEKGLSAYLEF